MAVNSITFGNINSADYGIYISGEGVFDAPKRAVEMVNVPGRSGAIALDQGYYENITVTYPAYNYEPDMADFKQALSDFRNALASQVGYQRLSDTFHPGEYRMAVFDEGLDINPIKYNTASQFDIKFDCKPQRYLTSGETEITVESGDTLTNPTRYESSPLLELTGYGSISFNGYNIQLGQGQRGETTVLPGGTIIADPVAYFYWADLFMPTAEYNTGDTAYMKEAQVTATWNIPPTTGKTITSVTAVTPGLTVYGNPAIDGGFDCTITYTMPVGTWTTGSSADIAEQELVIRATFSDNSTRLADTYFSVRCAPESLVAGEKVYFRVVDSDRYSPPSHITGASFTYSDVIVDSTKSIVGAETYIDCDLGEVYIIDDGQTVSLNKYVSLGSDLPTLAPGENEVTFDNTITELKIVPRWWKL